MTILNFGSLNARGIKKIIHNDGSLSLNLDAIIEDMNNNKIDVLGIQESWFGEFEYLQREKGYISFFSNTTNNRFHGTGIIVRSHYDPIFNKIGPRVSTAYRLNLGDKNVLFISAYAPHETLAAEYPDQRKTFYNDL